MIHFPGKTDLRPLTNGMTEFKPVVGVVHFYWPDTLNECLGEGHSPNVSENNLFLELDLKNDQNYSVLKLYQNVIRKSK